MRYLLSTLAVLCVTFGAIACGGRPAGQASSFELGAKSAPPEPSTAYAIKTSDRVDEGSRKRAQAKVVLDEGLDADRAIEAVRAAIQELLPADGEVEVVEILVYQNESEVSGDWTFGHAFASKDGKGWTGDGTFGKGVFDRNNIELDLKLPSGEEHFSLAR